jgi:hypothetical protein
VGRNVEAEGDAIAAVVGEAAGAGFERRPFSASAAATAAAPTTTGIHERRARRRFDARFARPIAFSRRLTDDEAHFITSRRVDGRGQMVAGGR